MDITQDTDLISLAFSKRKDVLFRYPENCIDENSDFPFPEGSSEWKNLNKSSLDLVTQ